MVREKQFYKTFFSMLFLLAGQNVITLLVNLADNMMLGAYSEVSLSGAAAVNQVQFVFQMITASFGNGLAILGTQYFGKNDLPRVRQLASVAMRFAVVTALILFAVMSLIPGRVISIFTADEAIIAEGVRYVRIIRFTYLFFAVTQLLLAALRTAGDARIALVLSLVALGVNCCINYTLIFGRFGAPELGITGAAVGTLAARTVELAVLLWYLARREKKLRLRFRDYLSFDRTLGKDYVKVTLPVFVTDALWGFNTAAQNAILGHMTARAIAANSVASTLFLTVKSSAIGSSQASGFLIGRSIGEGDEAKVKRYAKTLQLLFLAIGAASSLILFLIRGPVLSVYRLEPETKAMAAQFLSILVVINFTMAYQMPTNTGIIKAGGATRYCMVLDLISTWVIVLPLACVLAFYMKAPPYIVVWCLNADQIFKGIPAFIKCNYGHWIHRLTRADSPEQ